jgi:hypothetical protein
MRNNVDLLRSVAAAFSNEAVICHEFASNPEPQNALRSSAGPMVDSDRSAALYGELCKLRARNLMPESIFECMVWDDLDDLNERQCRQRPSRRWRGTGLKFTMKKPSHDACWASFESEVASTHRLTADPSDCGLAFVEYEPADDGQWFYNGEAMPKDWSPFALPGGPTPQCQFKRSWRNITGQGFSADRWRVREARRCQVRAEVCKWVAQELLRFAVLIGDEGETTGWLTVTTAASLLKRDFPHRTLEKSRARVSISASRKKFVTNGKKGDARRIEPHTFNSWRLMQRDADLDKAD